MADYLVFLCLALAATLPGAFSDTPANCTYEDVLGTWAFRLGPAGFDKSLDCSKPFSTFKSLVVSLSFPDVAEDEFGNKGFWTLIYNQGFEVTVGKRKYFAFSNFTVINGTVTSYCHTTLPGWSHDFWGHNWACYMGQKMSNGNNGPDSITGGDKKLQPQKELDLERKYVENPSFVKEINSRQTLWRAAIYPELNDMTFGERLRRAGGVPKYGRPKLPHPVQLSEEMEKAVGDLPDYFDWRNINGVNFVSPVRNQDQCGSCYAFASMAMMEARLRIATNNSLQVVLSPQDVVSCSEYSQGCAGGFPYLIAGKYAEDFGAVEESCFPYLGRDNSCSEKSDCLRFYSTDYYYIGGFYGACSEPQMRLEVIKNGPIAISFEVYSDFQSYKGGIYQHTGLKDKFNPWEITNHVVLVVGYGEEAGKKYWIVKNSWGGSWGEEGYFRILRGVDECGMESMAVATTPLIP